jgi:hypothetical protein
MFTLMKKRRNRVGNVVKIVSPRRGEQSMEKRRMCVDDEDDNEE